MSRYRMTVDPALFVARGLSPDMAHAESLQAERSAILKRWPSYRPRNWWTNAVLPEDPLRGTGVSDGNVDPWNEPASPELYTGTDPTISLTLLTQEQECRELMRAMVSVGAFSGATS